MGKKIRFGLNMPGKSNIGSIEELQEYFDLASVMQYYFNGKLERWLQDRGHAGQVEQLSKLDSQQIDFKTNLCKIFGVEYIETKKEAIDPKEIERLVEKRNMLRKITDNESILENANNVAFNQEDLNVLLNGDEKQRIYLCGDSFIIPTQHKNKIYIGINEPDVNVSQITMSDLESRSIKFENVKLNGVIKEDNAQIEKLKSSEKSITDSIYEDKKYEKFLSQAETYEKQKDWKRALVEYEKAAKMGSEIAYKKMGDIYYYHSDDLNNKKTDSFEENIKNAIDCYKKVEDDAEVLCILGILFEKLDDLQEAQNYYKKSAEAGYYDEDYNKDPVYLYAENLFLKLGHLEKIKPWFEKYYDKVKIEHLVNEFISDMKKEPFIHIPVVYGLNQFYYDTSKSSAQNKQLSKIKSEMRRMKESLYSSAECESRILNNKYSFLMCLLTGRTKENHMSREIYNIINNFNWPTENSLLSDWFDKDVSASNVYTDNSLLTFAASLVSDVKYDVRYQFNGDSYLDGLIKSCISEIIYFMKEKTVLMIRELEEEIKKNI